MSDIEAAVVATALRRRRAAAAAAAAGGLLSLAVVLLGEPSHGALPAHSVAAAAAVPQSGRIVADVVLR